MSNQPIVAAAQDNPLHEAETEIRHLRDTVATLRAVGYAETQPKLANRDSAGNPIPENQLANRRVVMRINRKPIYDVVKIPTFRRAAEPAPSEDVAKGKGAKK